MLRTTFTLLLFAFALVATFAQTNVSYRATESKIHKLGKTKPMREISERERINPLGSLRRKRNKKRPDNFRGRINRNISRPELEHQGADPLRQAQNGSVLNTPTLNIDGLYNEFGSPHDPTGDVGTNHYVQSINGTEIGVFDLSGNLLERFSTSALWAEFGKDGAGDPIILFDELEKRWMFSEFDGPAVILIAISDDDDPMGSFTVYEFATPGFPDYPKYAIWPNAIVFTTNEDVTELLHNYFIQKDSLYAGAENVSLQRIVIEGPNTEANFYLTTPIDFAGNIMPTDQRPMVIRLNDSSWGGVPQDQIELFAFDINWNDINATQIELVPLITTPYDSYPCSAAGATYSCVPQLGGVGLDAIPEVIMNIPMFRRFDDHESIVLSFITDVTDGNNQSGIRWMELRRTENTNWSIYQEGTYAPDGLNRYMCSIAIDRKGNIGLGYNVSSTDTYVGVRYTGRYSTDPLGQMTIAEVNVADGIGPIQSNSRFGDYAQMAIDPVDALSFWFTTEYAGKEDNSKTRIVSFQLQKNNIDVRPTQLNSPVSGANLGNNQTADISITNVGLSSINSIKVDLFFQGLFVASTVVNDTLSAGETRNVVFNTPLSFPNYGTYNITAVTTLSNDENTYNDTISFKINNFAALDAEIQAVSIKPTCIFPINLPFELRNIGIDTIHSIGVELQVNNVVLDTIQVTQTIAPGASATLSLPVNNGQNGESTATLTVVSLNNQEDLNKNNNQVQTKFNYTNELVQLNIRIQTDSMPSETFWYIFDEVGPEIVFLGSGYSQPMELIDLDFCLKKNHCYVFEIFDFGFNGLCCGAGEGSLLITDNTGEIIIESNGIFSELFTESLCTGDGCSVLVNVETIAASSGTNADGAIIVNVLSGQAPFTFSIDGGTTFSESPVFNNLAPGTYEVVVRSQGGMCEKKETTVLEQVSGTNETAEAAIMEITPNPGNGFYRLTISGLNNEGYILPVSVMDASGRNIQQFSIQRYGDVFKSDLSLMSYPQGVYYVKISTSKGVKIVKVIRT